MYRPLPNPLPVIVLLVVYLAGCATPAPRELVDDVQTQLIAEDFVSALARLRGYDPQNTTVQMRADDSPFGERLETGLRHAGYGIQLVPDDDAGPMLVSWEAEGYRSRAGESVGYRLRIGAVELGREYEIRTGRVFPMTALSVRGVPIDTAPLDAAIFDRTLVAGEEQGRSERVDTEFSDTGSRLSEATVNARIPTSGRVAVTPLVKALPDSVLISGSIEPGHEAQQWETVAISAPAAFADTARRNVLELGRSNFAPLLADYDTRLEHTLVFGDDSLRLGNDNKAVLGGIVEQFDPATDLVSVLGCSHGPTTLRGGNGYLAIGRANRVREELIRAGLAPERVLEEGCWAGTSQPDLPARAVVVSLRSRAAPAAPDGT